MVDKIEKELKIEFANKAGMLASRLSLNPTVGQIYGLLYMSPKPVSLNEMVENLGISKGAISTNVRILESWGAVRKVWVDSSRKDYYEANPDTLGIIINRLREGVMRRVKEARQNLESIEENVAGSALRDGENEAFYRERIDNIKDMYKQVTFMLNIIKENGGKDNE